MLPSISKVLHSLVVFSLIGVGSVSTAAASSKPNVLFITIDDLRVEIGCYGQTHVKTPVMDRLAARGMRFDRAYVQAAFCNPSRNSFLTGLRPDTTRIFGNRTRLRDRLPDVVTLPQLFREQGYRTIRLGKIFHGGADMDDPKSWDVALYPKVTDVGRRGEGRNLTGGAVKWCRWLAAEGDDEDQPDGQIAREAVRFLRQGHEAPFFLAVGFNKPHDPFVAPKKYFDMYPLEELKLYRDPANRTPDSRFALGSVGWKREFDKFTDQERKEFLRSYYAGTTFVDTQIGKVLKALQESGAAESTIVVLISDHGYHLGERGWWNKNTLFELTARTPMIVYRPGMKAAGQSCSRLVEFVDIFPTLTELCGLPAPAVLEGRSFAPLLDDPRQHWKEAAFTQLVRGPVEGRSVRTERWRYIEWDRGQKGAELYDHETDPREYTNVASDPAHGQLIARLRALLRGMSKGAPNRSSSK